MNVIKTIGKEESSIWIDMLFRKGPHSIKPSPEYPPCFPLKNNLSVDVTGHYFYLVYNNTILGYAKISHVEDADEVQVGESRKTITVKATIVLESEFKKMPFYIHCRGFQGARYLPNTIHDKTKMEAMEILKAKGFKDIS